MTKEERFQKVLSIIMEDFRDDVKEYGDTQSMFKSWAWDKKDFVENIESILKYSTEAQKHGFCVISWDCDKEVRKYRGDIYDWDDDICTFRRLKSAMMKYKYTE